MRTNSQILTSNWEQSEFRRLDEIYHDSVDRRLLSLAIVPESASHLDCKYVVLVKDVWQTQLLDALPDPIVQMGEDSRLQCSVCVKSLDSCGDVEKNPGPGR